MVFKELQDEVLYRATLDASEDVHRSHAKQLINAGISAIRNIAPWKSIRISRSFATIDGQEEYRLPVDVGEIGCLWHEEFGYKFPLNPITNLESAKFFIDTDTEGIPEVYYLWEVDSTLAQPSTAGTVSIVSSSTSDTSQQVRIDGLVSSYQDSEEENLNGTTAVTTTKSFSRVDRVTLWCNLDAPVANEGRITVTIGSTTITVLPPNFYNKIPSYYRVKLFPIPDASTYTIYVDAYGRFHRLEKDSDANPLGEDFNEAVILYAASKLAKDLKLSTKLKTDLKDEISILRAKNNRNNDRIWRMHSRDEGFMDKSGFFLRFGDHFPSVPR